jgi:hypothetical protein
MSSMTHTIVHMHERKEATPMMAMSIVGTWLTLTTASFAGLSFLSRAGEREERRLSLALAELQPAVVGQDTEPDPRRWAR